MGDITEVSAQAQTIFKERPVPDFDAGYGSKVTANAKNRIVENEDQIHAYRHHAGPFPKFAKFNRDRNEWIVGTVNAQNGWAANAETFPDKPV